MLFAATVASPWPTQAQSSPFARAIVGSQVEYSEGDRHFLLSRSAGRDVWCIISDNVVTTYTDSIKEQTYDTGSSEPFTRFLHDGSRSEIIRRFWPIRVGKVTVSTGSVRFGSKQTRWRSIERVVSLNRLTFFQPATAASYLVQTTIVADRDIGLGKKVVVTFRYVPEWRLLINLSVRYEMGDGKVVSLNSTLTRVYVPGIIGKAQPVPPECRPQLS